MKRNHTIKKTTRSSYGVWWLEGLQCPVEDCRYYNWRVCKPLPMSLCVSARKWKKKKKKESRKRRRLKSQRRQVNTIIASVIALSRPDSKEDVSVRRAGGGGSKLHVLIKVSKGIYRSLSKRWVNTENSNIWHRLMKTIQQNGGKYTWNTQAHRAWSLEGLHCPVEEHRNYSWRICTPFPIVLLSKISSNQEKRRRLKTTATSSVYDHHFCYTFA